MGTIFALIGCLILSRLSAVADTNEIVRLFSMRASLRSAPAAVIQPPLSGGVTNAIPGPAPDAGSLPSNARIYLSTPPPPVPRPADAFSTALRLQPAWERRREAAALVAPRMAPRGTLGGLLGAPGVRTLFDMVDVTAPLDVSAADGSPPSSLPLFLQPVPHSLSDPPEVRGVSLDFHCEPRP